MGDWHTDNHTYALSHSAIQHHQWPSRPRSPGRTLCQSRHHYGSILCLTDAIYRRSALVQPIAVGPAADGSVSSVAIGLALQFVAAEQVAAQKAGADIRYVVSIPIEPGGVWSVDEVTGLVACINANIPISQAAGNDYYHFVIPEFPNELIAEAMQPNGSFYPYSNVGIWARPWYFRFMI